MNSPSKEQFCVIWLHGLGADSSDMRGLAEQLTSHSSLYHHVFIDAPIRPITINNGMAMRAWYDILGTKLTDREDKSGIEQSENIIKAEIQAQIAKGYDYNQIILAGFSQGGAMALYTGLQFQHDLAGIIALSAYLPMASEIDIKQPSATPIFMANGKYDPIVLPGWTEFTKKLMKMNDFKNITSHEYDMEHSVCMEEIRDISSWLINLNSQRNS